jgi:hypothetical protein
MLLAGLALLGGVITAEPAAAQQVRGAQPPAMMQNAPMSPGAQPMTAGMTPSGPGTASMAAPLPAAVQPGTGATATVVPTAGDVGICQCIADRSSRKLSCLSSAAECQSSCASTHYAFTPHAIYSCPMTPEPASVSTSASR